MTQNTNALSNLSAPGCILPDPYLIKGPQAAYHYHRWLQPIDKMVDISIPADKFSAWHDVLGPHWTLLSDAPTVTQLRHCHFLAVLTPDLTEKRYHRRVMRQGLAFLSAEDVCIDLLQSAQTQIGLTEIAALLIKQGNSFDWSYLLGEIGASWLAFRLAEIINKINEIADHIVIEATPFEMTTAQPPQIQSLRSDSLTELIRPLRAQWSAANVQYAGS